MANINQDDLEVEIKLSKWEAVFLETVLYKVSQESSGKFSTSEIKNAQKIYLALERAGI